MARIVNASLRPMSTQRSLRRFSLSSGPIDLRLEAELWSALSAIATDRRLPLATLVDTIDQQRGTQPLSRALWRFAIAYMRALTDLAQALPPAPPRRQAHSLAVCSFPKPIG